jgi:hypothetical protein
MLRPYSPFAPQTRRFSLNPAVIQDIMDHAKPLGHHATEAGLNLGFGFMYYAMVRALRPKHVLVIGSGHGFSVICLALGLKDNQQGVLSFVDPSYSLAKNGPFKTIGGKDNWSDPQAVRTRFARFGLEDIVRHFKMTSAEFFSSYEQSRLPKIHLAFIDGNHSFNDVRADFLGVHRHCVKNSYVLLHDTNIYIRELLKHSGVKRWLQQLASHPECFELVNFPFDSGVALVRILNKASWSPTQ